MEGLNQDCVLCVLAYYIYTSSKKKKKNKVVSRRLVPLNSYIDSVTLLNSASEGFCFLAMLKL